MLAIFFTTLTQYPLSASPKSEKLRTAFNNYLSNANSKHDKEMNLAKATYEPLIEEARKYLLGSQKNFENWNQIQILKSTSHSPTAEVIIDAIKCPETRIDCKHPVYKTNEFTVGDQTRTYDFIGGDNAFFTDFNSKMNFAMIQTVEMQISSGLIQAKNPQVFQSVIKQLRAGFDSYYQRLSAYEDKKREITLNLSTAQEFDQAISDAVISLKRADKYSSRFEKEFLISFKFEYNRRALDRLASEPWDYVTSLKALNSAVALTKLSERADSIASSYKSSEAKKLNQICGNEFLRDLKFKESLELVSGIFKSVTGKKL